MARVAELVQEFRDQRRSGRASVRAADVAEGVAVAEQLKASGEAQWFRGQTQDWPKLAPTIWRLAAENIEPAKQQFSRLADWAQRTPGLEALSATPDALLAVAQHYGIPTSFLDFTTEPRVAGFFAADGQAPPEGVDSVIICLNLVDARRRWSKIAGDLQEPVPELLVLDVPNLWRLEAQHGTFVWCPYDSLDAPYPLDRITFPHKGRYRLAREDIYPARASPLEQVLNQFFQAEENRGGMNVIAAEMQEAGVVFETLDFELPDYRIEAFVQAPDPHSSWESTSIARWLVLDREYWRDAASGPETILRFWLETPTLMGLRLMSLVAGLCSEDASLRTGSPRWVPEVDADEALREALRSGLQQAWDGMARLPYTSNDIAAAMGTTAALVLARELEGSDADAANSIFSEPLAVEIARSDLRSYARAWARSSSIQEAVRDDFETLLVATEREATFAQPSNLLLTARDPRLLFSFDRLTTVFAQELIPTQIALDRSHPTIFSPARVHVIGPA